ncbi:MAG: transcriptional regulator [Methylophaga sp.]|nr:MAG: transcriptional regulator [Methylophaga sp.]
MFHYTSCGLQNIWLRNGYRKVQTPYGLGSSISDLEGLHAVIGMHIVNTKPKLSGAEVRFLRKELDLPQVQLAQLLGVSEVSVRGWENHRTKISKPADKILRLLYSQHINGDGDTKEFIERLSYLNRAEYTQKFEIEESDRGWQEAA